MTITYEVREGIAHITLCRPEKHNALRDEDIDELIGALRQLDADDRADIAVLSGAGRSFCAGSDIHARLLPSAQDGVNSRYRTSELETLLQCVNSKPIVAAVHGYVIGHGLGTAMVCDFIVASADTIFQAPEVKLGIPLGVMWSQIAYLATPAFANDVVMTGRTFDAREAHRAGLLTQVAEDGEHRAGAETLARTLLENPQPAVRELVRCRRSTLAEVMQHARGIAGNFRWDLSSDFRTAIRAKTDR